jgi:hypothetical protein
MPLVKFVYYLLSGTGRGAALDAALRDVHSLLQFCPKGDGDRSSSCAFHARRFFSELIGCSPGADQRGYLQRS